MRLYSGVKAKASPVPNGEPAAGSAEYRRRMCEMVASDASWKNEFFRKARISCSVLGKTKGGGKGGERCNYRETNVTLRDPRENRVPSSSQAPEDLKMNAARVTDRNENHR